MMGYKPFVKEKYFRDEHVDMGTIRLQVDQQFLQAATVTANYEEDTYRLVMGRYVLFGVKWNFGKMNAAHSARAQQAAINMIF
ncbi:MAG: hypothetical protein IJ156_06010 [Bacteroidales bacterium]|nr:hypothetical protein [Bacteroidales bacterium]